MRTSEVKRSCPPAHWAVKEKGIVSLTWCQCLFLGSGGSFSTSENNSFFFFFNVNFIWQQPHYGNNRLDQCRSISQTPSAGKEGRQKSMGSLLACAAACLEVIPVMSCPRFLETDCSMALGSWMLGERSAGHPGHPTHVGNGLLAHRLWLPAWLCLSSSHAQHHQPVASPCLLSHCCPLSHHCHTSDGFRIFPMPAVCPLRCHSLAGGSMSRYCKETGAGSSSRSEVAAVT